MKSLIKKNILNLKPYSVVKKESLIRMDANELPFNLPSYLIDVIIKEIGKIDFNYYPDPDCVNLKLAISDYCGVGTEHIVVGNGSDELLHLIATLFIDIGDKVLMPVPTFEMYKIYTQVEGGVIYEYVLNPEDYSFDVDAFIVKINELNPKMVILCNPNNPTGSVISQRDIQTILENFNGVLLIDEAYFEFFGQSSLHFIQNYPNLVIIRTCSKAFGLAGLRIGYMIANPEIIDYINRIRSPYNINAVSQFIAAYILKNTDLFLKYIEDIKKQREYMKNDLKEIPQIKVYDSFTNFILLKVPKPEYIYQRLRQEGILVRIFNNVLLKDCIRVTVSKSDYNLLFLKTLRKIMGELNYEECRNREKDKGNFY